MRLIDADALKKAFKKSPFVNEVHLYYARQLINLAQTVEERPHENVAKEAIKEIREMCWGYDIPSPCCPEYREHHEQMQKIIGLCDSWLKKLEEGDPE